MDAKRIQIGKSAPTFSRSASQELPVAKVRERAWQTALETLRIRNSWQAPVQQPPDALIRRYDKTDLLIQEHRLPVRFVGYAPLFNGSLIYNSPKCDWAIMSLPDDPFYNQHNGRLYAPRSVVADLKKFSEVGLSFDAIFIAHEIPKNSVRPFEEIPFDLIAPSPTLQAQARLNFLSKTSFWSTAAEWFGIAARGVSHGLRALEARDPILFGVQFDQRSELQERPIGMWYYLTHWFWDAGEVDR